MAGRSNLFAKNNMRFFTAKKKTDIFSLHMRIFIFQFRPFHTMNHDLAKNKYLHTKVWKNKTQLISYHDFSLH